MISSHEKSWKAVPATEIGLTGENWNRTALAMETGSMFHTVEWVRAMARGFDRSAVFTAFLDSSGTVRALFPAVVGKVGPFTTAYSPVTIVTPYGGPACAIVDTRKALESILGFRASAGWDYLRIAIPPVAAMGLKTAGTFRVLEGTTRLVPLGDETMMWKGLNRRCRRYIAKADKAGAEVRDLKDFAFLDKYLGWGTATYSRAGERFPTPHAFYHALENLVWPTGRLLIRGSFTGDRPVTIEFFGLSAHRLYAVDSAMDRGAEVEGAGNKLTWDTMCLAAKRGAREFDMLGTNIPRIAEYKASFGGELAPAPNLEIASASFRLAKGIAEKVRGGGKPV